MSVTHIVGLVGTFTIKHVRHVHDYQILRDQMREESLDPFISVISCPFIKSMNDASYMFVLGACRVQTGNQH